MPSRERIRLIACLGCRLWCSGQWWLVLERVKVASVVGRRDI